MEEGTYAFDAEGKLIQGATDKNGIVKDDEACFVTMSTER